MRQFVSFLRFSSPQISGISPQVALLALAGVCLARPHVNSGVPAGPLTPAVGDLVATPKGYRSLALEGFSEDLDQDGFVDPIGQAVPVVQHVAAPVISYAAAPALTYAAAPAPDVKFSLLFGGVRLLRDRASQASLT